MISLSLIILTFLYLYGICRATKQDSILSNDNDILQGMERYRSLPLTNLWICKSLSCLQRFAASHSNCHSRQLIMAAITYDIKNDYMFPYFIPWLVHLFGDHPSADVTFFVYDYYDEYSTASDQSGQEILFEMAKLLPSCTSFLIFHCHAMSVSFHPYHLIEARKRRNISRHIIFHLSHEIAYDVHTSSSWSYNCYGNESTLSSYYQQYDLVVKQYYYQPLSKYTLYLPLGPRDYYVLQSIKKLLGVKPIQDRKYLCTFSGRFYYDIPLPEHYEREEIGQLVSSSQFPCIVISSQNDVYGTAKISHTDYLSLIADTVFTPCPAGSAPETFRLYEAFELGSIPITVRPKREVVNYINAWTNYPGPILDSWQELSEYFNTLGLVDTHDICSTNFHLKFCNIIDWNDLNTSRYHGLKSISPLHRYLNHLQHKISIWYHQLKQDASNDILAAIMRVFDSNSYGDDH